MKEIKTRMFNDTFYPTPRKLIKQMVDKIDWSCGVDYILEPSAGKGDIILYLHEKHCCRNIHAIEIDQSLQTILRGINYCQVVDSDFLSHDAIYYSYDLIISNPPFNEGDLHLLKAIDIIYSGQIIFLLNAETLRNPYSNTRQLLANKLTELNADIEYIPDAFIDAERKTKVEVALVYIKIIRDAEEDLLKGVDEKAAIFTESIEEEKGLLTANKIEALISEYNTTIDIGITTIRDYFKNYRYINKWITLNGDTKYNYESSKEMTELMKKKVNEFMHNVRITFWNRCMDLTEFDDRLTSKKREALRKDLTLKSELDFSKNNVKAVLCNLIESYEDTLTQAVRDTFDRMSCNYAYHQDLHNKNVHYYNGWKTNKAFYVNKKVIIPLYILEAQWKGGYKVSYQVTQELNDIDKVMNFFVGLKEYKSIVDAVNESLVSDQFRKIQTTFFEVAVFKKGTIHLTFKDDDLLRKFNYVACKDKAWLPQDYGRKKYESCTKEEQSIIDEFEGKESYERMRIQPTFAGQNNRLMIGED